LPQNFDGEEEDFNKALSDLSASLGRLCAVTNHANLVTDEVNFDNKVGLFDLVLDLAASRDAFLREDHADEVGEEEKVERQETSDEILVRILNYGLCDLLRRVFATLKHRNGTLVDGIIGDRVTFVAQCEELMNVGSEGVKDKVFRMFAALTLALPSRTPEGADDKTVEDLHRRLRFQLSDEQYTHCFNHVVALIAALDELPDDDENSEDEKLALEKSGLFCIFGLLFYSLLTSSSSSSSSSLAHDSREERTGYPDASDPVQGH